MMQHTGSFGYARVDRVQVLELPYATGTLSMVVLLPDDPGGLGQLEKSITAETFVQWMALLKPIQVAVHIPRFKSASDFRLDDALKALGMLDAFSQAKADFEGMTGKKDLFVGGVFHSSFVDVNEEGTEAGGASGAVMKLKSGAVPVFKADHPFLYVIRHIPSNCILFLGRMARPQP
jgi:serpin B